MYSFQVLICINGRNISVIGIFWTKGELVIVTLTKREKKITNIVFLNIVLIFGIRLYIKRDRLYKIGLPVLSINLPLAKNFSVL